MGFVWFSNENKSDWSHTGKAQWLKGRVLDSRPWGCGFKSHWHQTHYDLDFEQDINPCLVLVQPRKTLT